MSMSPKVAAKYMDRIAALIAEGQAIHGGIKTIPPEYINSGITNRPTMVKGKRYQPEHGKFVKWKLQCVTVLEQIVPQSSLHWKKVKGLDNLGGSPDQVTAAIHILKGIKEDFEEGYFDNLYSQVQAEIACDYLGQAENLISEGGSGKYDHVPAAVLAGAVLENALRMLCSQQTPPIPLNKTNGKPKTLDPLVTDLKKAGLFNEVMAQQIRGWIQIRNKAAHGEFDEFTEDQVKAMLLGVKSLLAQYM